MTIAKKFISTFLLLSMSLATLTSAIQTKASSPVNSDIQITDNAPINSDVQVNNNAPVNSNTSIEIEDISEVNPLAESVPSDFVIRSVTNPYPGTFEVSLWVPPYRYATCDLHFYLDGFYNTFTKVDSKRVDNNTSNYVAMTVVFNNLPHLGKYLIKAGAAGVLTQDAVATNRFYGVLYSEKFTWTQEKVDAYIRNERIGIVLAAIGAGIADLVATKGASSLLTALDVCFNAGNVDVFKTIEIRTSPALGYSYQTIYVQEGDNYKVLLSVYSDTNSLIGTYELGKYRF